MVIQVENLVKVYGQIRAVDGISFEVKGGEVFGMLGPNGAGKTTTVEIIEGLRQADSGQVTVLGMNVAQAPDKVKQKIGTQLQAPSMLPLLTARETLETFGGFYNHSLPVDELLKLVSLEESSNILVKNMSGGQQQRLSVALAMVNDPDIAFLDEPTTGLDPQARRGLWSVIEGMRNRDKTIFLTTHYLEEAERLCDRVAVVDHGKIIAMGSPSQLIRENFEEKAIQFFMEPSPSPDEMKKMAGAINVMIDENEVVIYSNNIPKTMSDVLKYAEQNETSGHIRDLHVREASLEDVFLKLTGRKIRE